MPWYYVEIIHGPGHQSTYSKYVWFDEPANLRTVVGKEVVVSAATYLDTFEYPVVRVCKKVARLPENERKHKETLYRSEIDHAQRMLKILKEGKNKDKKRI